MTKTEFEPDDFIYDGEHPCFFPNGRGIAAGLANRKLPKIKAAWLEELKKNAVRVYGREMNGRLWAFSDEMSRCVSIPEEMDNRTALLIDIQPIEKQKCSHHSPIDINCGKYTCTKCGAELTVAFVEVR